MSGIIGQGSKSGIVGSSKSQVEIFYDLRRPHEANPGEMFSGYHTSGSLENTGSTDSGKAWCSGIPPRHWSRCLDINFWFNMNQRNASYPPNINWRWNISQNDSANDAYDSGNFVLFSSGLPVSAANDLFVANGIGLVGNSYKFEDTLHNYDRPLFQISVWNVATSSLSGIGVAILWQL